MLQTYDVMTISDQSHLIKKHESEDEIEFVVAYEDLYDKLYDYHINKTGHGGRVKMEVALRNKLSIPRPAIECFIQCCKSCNEKKQGKHKIVVRPIVSKDFNERGQVDLIDFQSLPDKQYKWILNYQDHATKFLFLRPMETKRAEEVASNLLSIFLLIGAPKILQSDNGREFVNKVILELKDLWPECIIVHGRPRHPQSQGSIERSNQDVENMIRAWMADTNCKKWSVGLQFVQWQKNCSFHRTIGRSPYKALLGCEPKVGLASSNIPSALAKTLTTEEELMKIMNEEDSVVEISDAHEGVADEDADITNVVLEEKNINRSEELMCENCLRVVNFAEVCQQDGSSVLCILCAASKNISEERDDARNNTEKAAKKMLGDSAKKMPTFNVGDCVLLNIPKVDRGPGDSRNMVCLIMDQKNGVNQVAGKHGIIKGWFGAESLTVAGSAFLNKEEIPVEKSLSLREAVSLESGGQGMLKCLCKPSKQQCSKNKCICKKNSVLCNSRCHKSLPCFNK